MGFVSTDFRRRKILCAFGTVLLFLSPRPRGCLILNVDRKCGLHLCGGGGKCPAVTTNIKIWLYGKNLNNAEKLNTAMDNLNIVQNQNVGKISILQKSHQAQGKTNDEIGHRNSREFTKRIFCDIPGPIGGRDDGDEGVLGGDHEVRGAVEGVGSGGEHPEGMAAAPVADGSQSKDPTASMTTAFRMKPQTGQGLSGSAECLDNSALKAIYKKKSTPHGRGAGLERIGGLVADWSQSKTQTSSIDTALGSGKAPPWSGLVLIWAMSRQLSIEHNLKGVHIIAQKKGDMQIEPLIPLRAKMNEKFMAQNLQKKDSNFCPPSAHSFPVTP